MSFCHRDTPDTPAEYASKNVVVTVASTINNNPVTPNPSCNSIWAKSDVWVYKAMPSPIAYIHALITP